MQKIYLVLATMVLLLGLLAGCNGDDDDNGGDVADTVAVKATMPATATDLLGRFTAAMGSIFSQLTSIGQPVPNEDAIIYEADLPPGTSVYLDVENAAGVSVGQSIPPSGVTFDGVEGTIGSYVTTADYRGWQLNPATVVDDDTVDDDVVDDDVIDDDADDDADDDTTPVTTTTTVPVTTTTTTMEVTDDDTSDDDTTDDDTTVNESCPIGNSCVFDEFEKMVLVLSVDADDYFIGFIGVKPAQLAAADNFKLFEDNHATHPIGTVEALTNGQYRVEVLTPLVGGLPEEITYAPVLLKPVGEVWPQLDDPLWIFTNCQRIGSAGNYRLERLLSQPVQARMPKVQYEAAAGNEMVLTVNTPTGWYKMRKPGTLVNNEYRATFWVQWQ